MLPKAAQGRMKAKRLTAPKHLDMVRQLPCALCRAERSDTHCAAHHLLRGTVRGTGLKAGDNFVIPLCHEPCHGALHRNGDETAYLLDHGLNDPLLLAAELWEHTGNFIAMRRVISLFGVKI